MSGEYVGCESELKMSLCMNANCMCRRFLEYAVKSRADIENNGMKLQCAVYDFSKEIKKYGFGGKQIMIIADDKLENITVI